MKKFIVALVFLFVCLSVNAQQAGIGVSKGFQSFSNTDRGNVGVWFCIWKLEYEIYFDINSYDDLNYDLGEYYTEYYKTYAGTSYTKVHKTKGYCGSVGGKLGYMFNNYISAGVAYEFGGAECTFTHETTYLSTIHDGWCDTSIKDNSKFGVGGYVKLSYPFKLNKSKYIDFLLSPFISLQITTTNHNFISIGTMFSFSC